MSNIAANLTVTSSNLLATPVNITVNTSATNQNYGKMGSIKIQPGEFARLTEFNCGPKGAYVYVQSPNTNPANVAINLHKISDTSSEDESFITLQPGDFAWVPLTANVRTLSASTTNGGAATLNFLYSDRGGEWGNSVLKVFIDNDNAWKYFIFDAESGVPGAIINLELSDSWSVYPINFVQQKGYTLIFANGNDNLIVFIGSDGKIITQIDLYRFNQTVGDNNGFGFPLGGVNYNYDTEQATSYAKGYVLAYTQDYGGDYPVSKLAYFDGDKITYHDFPNCWDNQITIDNSAGWDNSTENGTAVLFLTGVFQAGYPDDDFYVLVNSSEHNIIDITAGPGYTYDDPLISINANYIVFLRKVSGGPGDGDYQTILVYNTKAQLLQDLDISGVDTDIRDLFRFYGNGNFLVSFHDDTTENQYYFIHYNSSTNSFSGNDLTWTVDDTYEYVVSCNQNNPLVDYEAPWSNYTGNSISVLSWIQSGSNLNNAIAYERTVDAFVDYIIGNNERGRYVLADGSAVYINPRGDGDWNQNHGLAGAIIIPYVDVLDMRTLILRPGEGNPDDISLTDIIEINADELTEQQFRPISDTEFFYWTYSQYGDSYYTVFGIDGTLKDTFSAEDYLWNYRIRQGCLLVRTPNWNTSTANEFSWIYQQGTGEFLIEETYYPYRRNSNYSTVSGLNDGRILLTIPPDYDNNDTSSFIMRLLTKDTLSDEFVLPRSYGSLYQDNNYYPLQMGENHICYYYQNQDLDYVFNLYDLDFNLVNSATASGLTRMSTSNSGQATGYGQNTNGYGKRFYFQLQNTDQNRDYYFMITPTAHFMKEVSISANTQLTLYNDAMWAYIND